MAPPRDIKTILVVDDNAQKRAKIVEIARHGYPNANVIQATSPLGGLVALQRHDSSIDLVLTDLSMPAKTEVTRAGSAGFAIAQAATHFAPNAPVLILTTGPEATTFRRGVAAGADGVLGHYDFYEGRGLPQVVNEIRGGHLITNDDLVPQVAADLQTDPSAVQRIGETSTICSLPRPPTLEPATTDLFRSEITDDQMRTVRELVEIGIWRSRLNSAFLREAFQRGAKGKANNEEAVNDGLTNLRSELDKTSIDSAIDAYLADPPQGGLPIKLIQTALLFQEPNEVARLLAGTHQACAWYRSVGLDMWAEAAVIRFRAPSRFSKFRSREPGEVSTPSEVIAQLAEIELPKDIFASPLNVDSLNSLLDGAQPLPIYARELYAGAGQAAPELEGR